MLILFVSSVFHSSTTYECYAGTVFKLWGVGPVGVLLRRGVFVKCFLLVTVVNDVITVILRRHDHMRGVRGRSVTVFRARRGVGAARHCIAALMACNRSIVM